MRVLFALTMVATACAAAEPPADVKLDLYLLAGQSNMAGRGTPEASDKTPDPRIWMLDKDKKWVPAVDPLHFDKPIAGVGPGSEFARVLAKADPKAHIGLVPAAMGGSAIRQWAKGAANYRNAIERAKAAQAHGKLRGIIWHQGEADSKRPIEDYIKDLEELIARFRADLGDPELPVVVGQLGDFLDPTKYPQNKAFNEALAKVPERVKNAGCAKSAGATCKGDKLHFDTPGAREMGRRYAAEMIRLRGGKGG